MERVYATSNAFFRISSSDTTQHRISNEIHKMRWAKEALRVGDWRTSSSRRRRIQKKGVSKEKEVRFGAASRCQNECGTSHIILGCCSFLFLMPWLAYHFILILLLLLLLRSVSPTSADFRHETSDAPRALQPWRRNGQQNTSLSPSLPLCICSWKFQI